MHKCSPGLRCRRRKCDSSSRRRLNTPKISAT
jgi:hypothetical protein